MTLRSACPPPAERPPQAACAAAAQAQANFSAPPPPPPEQADLPRLGFISYDMHEALFPGGPSLYDVALAFGNKGYPGGLVFALNQVPAAVHKFDVVFTAGVRLLSVLVCGHPAVDWLRLLSSPCPNKMHAHRQAQCFCSVMQLCQVLMHAGSQRSRLRCAESTMLLLFLQQAAVDSSDYTTSAAIPVVRFTEHDFRLHPAYERPAVLALSREEVRNALTIRGGFATRSQRALMPATLATTVELPE